VKQFARLFGADRGAEIHALIEGAMGPCPCRSGEPCWTLLDVAEQHEAGQQPEEVFAVTG